MDPPAASSGAWRDYKHASNERTCLPAPVDNICGWSIVFSAIVFVAMLIAIWMSLPARQSTANEGSKKQTKKSKTSQKKDKSPEKKDEGETTERKKKK